MSSNAGCPVILSEDAVPEVVLRNECYVVFTIVGVAIFLFNDVPVNSQCNHFSNTKEKQKRNTRTEKIVPDGNSFVCYVEATKYCRLLSLVTQKVPGSPLKMFNADISDVNIPASICDLLFIWALF